MKKNILLKILIILNVFFVVSILTYVLALMLFESITSPESLISIALIEIGLTAVISKIFFILIDKIGESKKSNEVDNLLN